ncbi:hypothetical protein [Parvularcula lutaonensis]|uniref:Uncharacterized protein n=1 Tax=Parvularcula lutaonensis TaxID=491923 RepID=A0ABV7MDB4_9PROT|nr:hypothetical protein [Parvularcula lutaonensis]GGY52141.1 hypothetical protein GCM10007148_21520 [Parvularcula lutaonensis]
MKTKLLCGGALAVLMSGCASIVSDSVYPVTIDSVPTGADLKITDEKGMIVFEGEGPTTLTLKASDGYFSGANYTIEATIDGTVGRGQLTSSMDGWYIGNILVGGPIGLLIVDPATGAMYKLPERVVVSVPVADATDEPAELDTMPSAKTDHPGAKIQVLSLNDVPEELRSELVRVN